MSWLKVEFLFLGFCSSNWLEMYFDDCYDNLQKMPAKLDIMINSFQKGRFVVLGNFWLGSCFSAYI